MNAHKVVIVDDEACDPAPAQNGAGTQPAIRSIEACTAREAHVALDIDRPDAVLLDLGLPDRDGLELVPPIVKFGRGAARHLGS